MHDPLIITVILNTNRRDDTLACLDSLASSTYANHRVIVLDNASSDGSVSAIRESFPAVEVIQLRENLGYAGNNNVGIQAALDRQADWVFVLNEDTIVAPECLTELITIGEADPRIGFVGPMVYHHNEPDVIQSAGGAMDRRLNTWHIGQNETDRGQFGAPHDVEWISGCAILARRTMIEQIGALDERFFYYWEEVEWCLRARRHGWRLVHVPAARLWHKGVQRDYRPKPAVTYYSTRNRFLMMSKHHATVPAWVVAWFQTLRTLISWSIKPKWRDMREHRDAMWRGMLDFLRQRWGRGYV